MLRFVILLNAFREILFEILATSKYCILFPILRTIDIFLLAGFIATL